MGTTVEQPGRLVVASGTNIAAPFPLAVVTPPAMHRLHLMESPSQMSITSDHASSHGWLYSTEHFPQEDDADAPADDRTVWLSPRAMRLLDVEPGDHVQLDIPATSRLNVISALIHDMPGAAEVHVAHDALARFRGSTVAWALLVANGSSAPVRVMGRDMDPAKVRLSMATRALLATSSQNGPALAAVTLAPLWPAPTVDRIAALGQPDVPAARRRLAKGLGSGRHVFGQIERLAAAWLGAPSVAVQTAEAIVGDDEQRIVRLPSDLFALLGLSPGDQVVVGWADHEVVGVALPFGPPETATGLAQLQRVEKAASRPDLLAHPAAHLTAGIAAPLRAELGIPRRTVVTVKRRLLPRIAGRANDLTLPLGGLVVAALAIQGFRIYWVVLVSLLILTLSFLPLRHQRPPRGMQR